MRPERREDPLELKARTVRSLGWSERGMGRRKAGRNRSPAAESLVIGFQPILRTEAGWARDSLGGQD